MTNMEDLKKHVTQQIEDLQKEKVKLAKHAGQLLADQDWSELASVAFQAHGVSSQLKSLVFLANWMR